MKNYIEGKSIIVTGGAAGFGKLISEKAAALGANVTCGDIDQAALEETVSSIQADGGKAQALITDVTSIADMKALAAKAMETYGQIDVMINNAGVMPLAFYSDHEEALEKWYRCIDINFKGMLNGIVSVYDQMMAQERGHVINVASIYGNFPVAGAAVYGATKAAVGFLSESLRTEARGKIKVTTVRPTGVPATGLGAGIVNLEATIGIVGQNAGEYGELMLQMGEGQIDPAKLDPENMDYIALDPAFIADQVIHVMNQPDGVSIGDITVRASGDHYIL